MKNKPNKAKSRLWTDGKKTTIAGLMVLAFALFFLYSGKITAGEFISLMPFVIAMLRVKDTFLGNWGNNSNTALIIIAIILTSCSTPKRLNKICKKCPAVETHDTVYIQKDSIVVKDSIMKITLPALPPDTISIILPCNEKKELLNINKRSFNYDYVTVDVWVKNGTINVKPFLNTDTINILIKNARIETYREILKQYKDLKQITVTQKYIPAIVWFLWAISIIILLILTIIYNKNYGRR